MILFGKLLASGLLGLTLATSSVDASPPDPSGTSTPDRFLKPGSLWDLGAEILKALREFRSETPSLTPEQRTFIRAVLESYRVDIGNQLRARVAAERALREAIRTNPALIDTAAQRLGETGNGFTLQVYNGKSGPRGPRSGNFCEGLPKTRHLAG
jgi:hypothetical protein